MKLFEPEALVAAMLNQINAQINAQINTYLNTQPHWQAEKASHHSTPHLLGIPGLNAIPGVGNIDTMLQQCKAFLDDLLDKFGGSIDPQSIQKAQQEYSEKMSALWIGVMQSKAPVLEDRRFKSPEWQNSLMHAYSAASYLINAHYLTTLAEAVQAPKRAKQKILFLVEQIIDAMSPANFLATNPEAQSKLIASQGESLTKGIENMLADMRKGHISLTDESAFEVGRNVATTEGQVIFENHLFQLIQYKPLQASVYQRPLLIVPPCINKFYILDLQPENSLVRFALEQGHSVFLISWANPTMKLGNVTWDDYVELGVVEAIRAVHTISGEEKINTFGFCIGGTLLATSLAVLAARGEQVAASVTLLTALLDFSDVGVLEVFVDRMQVELHEQLIGKNGLMSGRDLASTFSSLRANDLVWNYVQANYLKGENPLPFDLLYWNSDSTNLPGPMFCWYLRNTYLENNLKQPGKLTVAGEKVDLGKIDAPVFVYASRDDHIVPWTAAYASLALLNPKHASKNRFVLGASGHIAGVINPPAKMKRNYWSNQALTNNAAKKYQLKTADEWFEAAQSHAGSWWPEWSVFLAENAGKKVSVNAKGRKKPSGTRYQAIESAPGRYVKTSI